MSILMSLLLPGLLQARAKTKTAVCVSNQRQICLAEKMYLDDNDSVFSAQVSDYGYGLMVYKGENWYLNDELVSRDGQNGTVNVLLDKNYTNSKSLYLCPEFFFANSGHEGRWGLAFDQSHGYNRAVRTSVVNGLLVKMRPANVVQPSETIRSGDASSPYFKDTPLYIVIRHDLSTKTNMTFIDGHILSIHHKTLQLNRQWFSIADDTQSTIPGGFIYK